MKWDRLRRRIAPLAVVAALALIGARTCAEESAEVQVDYTFGANGSRVRSLRVDYVCETGEVVAFFERRFGAAGAGGGAGHLLRVDEGRYTARIRVTSSAGEGAIERRILAAGRATITVDLADRIP